MALLINSSDFKSLDTSLARNSRNLDSSITATSLFRLSLNSSLINAGTYVGIAYVGTAPDIGAFESDFNLPVSNKEIQIINFRLEQNFPNPFNPTTVIKYSVPSKGQASLVQLKVYDILGNEIAALVNKYQPKGTYEVEFNTQSSHLSSGVYLYQLKIGSFIQTRKMVLLK